MFPHDLFQEIDICESKTCSTIDPYDRLLLTCPPPRNISGAISASSSVKLLRSLSELRGKSNVVSFQRLGELHMGHWVSPLLPPLLEVLGGSS